MTIKFERRAVGDLLKEGSLHIPTYQRPYKWGRKHVRNLFYDVTEVLKQEKNSYQIGSVILHDHDNKGQVDIVDGQQRLISISLFLYALKKLGGFSGASNLLEQEFDGVSQQHARENFEEWENLIELVGIEQATKISIFLLEDCYLSVIRLPEDKLAEAFQLFDSQNNRGKALKPHDLLKAYHLRNVENPTEELISAWESAVADPVLSLETLFDQYLFRMRRWCKGETGLTKRRYGTYLRFTENFVDDFKGVNLTESYPYLKLYKELENHSIVLPQSLTMPIINGRSFFNYIEFAHMKIKSLKENLTDGSLVNQNVYLPSDVESKVKAILERKDRKFIRNRNLFDVMLLLFADRFGEYSLTKEVVETAFVWAYYPRVKAKAIYDATLGNYAAGGKFQHKEAQRLYLTLQQATTPHDFLLRIDRDLFENFTVEKMVEEIDK